MDFDTLIAKLREALDIAEGLQLNEMARINDTIEVNNEDITNEKGETQTKFPHFHWLYKRKIHFKFANRIPNNVSELKQLLAYKSDKLGISDAELKKVLKDIWVEINDPEIGRKTVYEVAFKTWENLHPNRDINSEVVVL